MKTLKTTFLLLAIVLFASSILFISCSKSEDPVQQQVNTDIIFENNNQVNITDKPNNSAAIPVYSEINVTANGSVLDYKKITLEMNIDHEYQRDLEFMLIAPDGTGRTFIYRRGLSNKYLADQKLRFNANATLQLPDDGQNFLTGTYKECKGSVSLNPPLVDPIFTFLQNKNINGIWKLRATDWETVNSGSIKSWRLVFSQGAY